MVSLPVSVQRSGTACKSLASSKKSIWHLLPPTPSPIFPQVTHAPSATNNDSGGGDAMLHITSHDMHPWTAKPRELARLPLSTATQHAPAARPQLRPSFCGLVPDPTLWKSIPAPAPRHRHTTMPCVCGGRGRQTWFDTSNPTPPPRRCGSTAIPYLMNRRCLPACEPTGRAVAEGCLVALRTIRSHPAFACCCCCCSHPDSSDYLLSTLTFCPTLPTHSSRHSARTYCRSRASP